MNLNKNFFLLFILILSGCYLRKTEEKEEDPYYIYLLYTRANEKGEFDKAKKYIERLVKLTKKQEFYKEYIFFLFKLRDYKKLKKIFFEYIKKFDVDSSLTYPFLTACMMTGDYKNFEKYEKIFREKFKNDKNLFYLISILYQTKGKYEKASEILDELILMDPENKYKYLIEKVRILINKKEFKDALNLIEEIEKEKGLSYELLIEKGILLENIKKYRDAIKIYKEAVKKSMEKIKLLKKIVNLSILIEDYETADSILSFLINSNPYDINLIHQMGYVNYARGKYKEAVKYFALSLALNPDNDLAHYYLARIFYREKMFDKAFYHIKKAIEINPRSNEYYVYYAFLLIAQRKLKDAEYVLREMPYKKDPAYYYLKGFLERQRKRYRRAISYYKKSLKIDSLDARKWFELGAIYETINDIKNAEKAFRKAIMIDSTMSEAYNYWGYMLAERGLKLDTAKILIEKALKYEPNNGYYLDSMGWVYYMMGKYDSAKVYLRQAASLVPDDPVIIEHLGDVYFKLNEIDKAINYWNEALKLNPENKKLKEKIKKNKRGI